MRDDVNVRCINHSCARTLARQVNYCPYCGINQSTALPRPVEPRAAVASAFGGTAFGAGGGAAVQSQAHVASAAPFPPAGASSADFSADSSAAAAEAAASAPAPQAASAYASAKEPAAAAPFMPPPAAADNLPPSAPKRVGPAPVRLRWILLALAAIWLVWVYQRPASPADARLEKRIDRAIGLAKACKPNEAQAELIALQARASAAQLARLQGALDQADSACHPERARAAGKTATGAGIAAPARRRPPSESARNLIAEARAAIARDDYRAASDKMEVCMAMVDGSPEECRVLKTRADRLDTERQRCEAGGSRWLGGQCQ
jgi:hypothetical protein